MDENSQKFLRIKMENDIDNFILNFIIHLSECQM